MVYVVLLGRGRKAEQAAEVRDGARRRRRRERRGDMVVRSMVTIFVIGFFGADVICSEVFCFIRGLTMAVAA